jgi:hypothetical protein
MQLGGKSRISERTDFNVDMVLIVCNRAMPHARVPSSEVGDEMLK